MGYTFEWHGAKARSNLEKHGVSFEEASSVFDDSFAAVFADDGHSDDEDRELIVGHSSLGRLLIVSFTERSRRIRVISARFASRKERRSYEENKES